MSVMNESIITTAVRVEFFAFFVKCFQSLNPGKELSPNWHIDAVIYQLMRCQKGQNNRLIINLPPRHLKSLLVSVAFPAWLLGHDPRKRIIVVTYSQELSNELSRQFRVIVNESWFRTAFPGTVAVQDTESEFITTEGGSRYSTSSGGTLTGRGADFIVIDDPLKPEDAFSTLARDKLGRWYKSTLVTRLDDQGNGVIVLVMQRLHVDDLTGRVLAADSSWHHLASVAEQDEEIPVSDTKVHARKTGDLLHSDRQGQQVVDRIKSDLGSLFFTAEYQQRPFPQEGNLVKRSWFPYYDAPLSS